MPGFLSSNFSMFICEANEKQPLTPDFLRKRAFSDTIDPDGMRSGWTGLGELLDTENFTFALVDGRFSGFSYRLDERRPSKPVIRLQVEEKIREEERGGTKVSAKRRKEIREEVTEKLTAQTDFAPSLIDCIWDDEKGRLFVATTSDKRLERVLALFKASFGMEAWPISPETDMSQVFASIQAAGGIQVDDFFLETIGSASLASAPQSEEKCTIAVQNSSETVTEAITQGMAIKKIAFVARENGADNEYRFTLGDDLIVRGIKLPKSDKDDSVEATFILHAEACSQVADIVANLAQEK